MLYGLEWLDEDTKFPPECECLRLEEYRVFENMFDLKLFPTFPDLFSKYIINFDEYFRTPMLLAYQRLLTIKTCDMILGEPPTITVTDNDELASKLEDIKDRTNFYEKLYQALIDYSRFGVTVYRIYNDDEYDEDKGNFAIWNPREWFPIFSKDGTKRIEEHVLVWRANRGTDLVPDYVLEIQRHPTKGGYYIEEKYQMDSSGDCVTAKLSSNKIETHQPCLVQYVANLGSSTNPYGTSDYKVVNELIFKATERLKQIHKILDKHADPSMTGPVTMLQQNKDTGELEFKASKFYATSPGEEHPEYLTWDGQLDAAFKELEVILNQIAVLSEMGDALLGKNSGVAMSGTAMRYKMVSPLEKARRAKNTFNLPIKKLMSLLLYIDTGKEVRYQDINVIWKDSLPKDPRETAELVRLQTGAPQAIPLKHALMENYDLDVKDAEHYIEEIQKDREMWQSVNDTQPRPGNEAPEALPSVLEKGSVNTPKHTGVEQNNSKMAEKREDTK